MPLTTLFITALLIGLWNMPAPNPQTAKRQATSRLPAVVPRRLRSTNPAAWINMPAMPRPREPIRSDNDPLSGPMKKVSIKHYTKEEAKSQGRTGHI